LAWSQKGIEKIQIAGPILLPVTALEKDVKDRGVSGRRVRSGQVPRDLSKYVLDWKLAGHPNSEKRR